MPSPSTAELMRAIAFPQSIGEPVWRERRTFPVTPLFGVPAAFLGVATVSVRPVGLQVVLGVAATVALVLLLRARRRGLIETYTVSAGFVAIEQPAGGRVAIPTDSLTSVTLQGDKVRLEGGGGVLTLGFVRRQRGLLRALERVAAGVRVERDMTVFCPNDPLLGRRARATPKRQR
jgi:hypothetical protein